MAKARCPICNTALADAPDPESKRYRPFCSKRCQLVDLSKWLDGDYRVAGPPAGDGGVVGYDDSEDA